MSRTLSPATAVPTKNIIASASAPRLTGLSVPTMKTTTSPMTPMA
jgi:hypothetical protein